MNENFIYLFYFLLTVITAMIFMAFPVSPNYQWMIPEWTLLVLIYWAVKKSYQSYILIGFMVGLYVDVIWHDYLGVNAILYASIMFVIAFFYPNLYKKSFFAQLELVTIAFLVKMFLVLIFVYFIHDYSINWTMLFQVIVTIVIWPLFVFFLNILTYYETKR